MKREIARRLTPEEEELQRKRAELAGLESELADRELELVTLHGELAAFEGKYLETVGWLYKVLDGTVARVAEALSRRNPEDGKARKAAEEAGARAQESAEAVADIQEAAARKNFKPSDDLKKLYREAAKAVHPDLASDDDDRARRQKLMADVNRAYEQGDEKRLREILDEWQASPEAVKGEGAGAELVRTIRKIARVGNRLRAIENEIEELEGSDIYKMKLKVEEAENNGRDLLAEMAAGLDKEIAEARETLAQLTRKG